MAVPKLVVALAAGLSVAALAPLKTQEERGENSNHAYNFGPLCVLMAEHLDHFTKVEAPAALTNGRFRPDAVVIDVTYGPGFSSFPQAQAAFQHAVNIWKTQLTSPVAVAVQADFSNLGADVLGYASYNTIARNFTGALMTDTWFPGPIANSLAGSAITGHPGIGATFSSAFNWYFGTDGLPPAGQYDFVSVVLHELGHGLGFAGSTRVSGGLGAWGSGSPALPYIYDRYLANASNQALTNTGIFANNSSALASQLTSNNVFWAGGQGVAANGGTNPRLYAPTTWASGSSISHLDDATFPPGNANSLMTHALGSAEAVHNPGPVARGMLRDSGATLDTSCPYTLSASSFTIGQPGGRGTVGVTTNAGCAWTATSNASFVTITASASASGSATVGYSVAANTGATRTGTLTIAGQTFTLTQTGSGTTMSVNRASLAFGAVNTGTLGNISASQAVTVTFDSGAPTWIATTATSWLQVAGGSGTGAGQFTVSVINASGLPTSGTVTGSVSVTSGGAGNSPLTIPVQLTLFPSTASSGVPFGAFDTPAAGATVAGSIPVTGWALDDIEVTRVELWRDRAVGENTPVFSGSGPGNGKIYIADPIFISGARPDIESGYPGTPYAYRAGWGYLLLTQGLWNQGNGSFTLYAFAYDRDGHSVTLGSKTITVANATATLPFGAIDTPSNGQTVSGSFWNFGWALTPNATPACTIGATGVRVSIDSAPLVPVTYGGARNDIASLFPGHSNTAGSGGAYYIDTSTLSNGIHQIGWYVVDSCNRAEGIGSRFFNVLNGSSVAASSTVAARAVTKAINGIEPIEVRRGFDSTWVYPASSGARVVPIGQDERVEVILPVSARGYSAHQIVDGERRALPLGSSFDAATGTFYWQPSAGFLGRYQIEFSGASGVIRVTAVVGTAVSAVIDTPRPGPVPSSFTIAGWAVDLAARNGAGIDAVHVWAYPTAGGAPVFLGVAAIGGERPDIAALHGDQFAGASFSLTTTPMAPGTYDIVVYPHSSVINDFRGAQIVRVRVGR